MSLIPTNQSCFANPARAKQLLSFEGMVYERNARPTDIDFAMEFGDKEFILGEVKLEGNDVPYGQKLFLSQFLSIIHQSGRKALGIIATHDVHDTNQEIPLKECKVVSIWFEGEWHKVESCRTVEYIVARWRWRNNK